MCVFFTLVLAVTGLFFAVPRNIQSKVTSNIRSIARDGWRAAQIVHAEGLLSDGNMEPVSVASAMFTAALFGVIDAGNQIKTDHIALLYLCRNSGSGLAYASSRISPWVQREFHSLNREQPMTAGFVGDAGRFVPHFFPYLFLGYNSKKDAVGVDSLRDGSSNVPQVSVDIASHYLLLGFAGKPLNIRRQEIYDARSVLLTKLTFALEVIATVNSQYRYSGQESRAFSDPFYLRLSASSLPVCPKRQFLALAGILIALLGATCFRICLSVDASWPQFFGSLALLILGVIIFHIGLSCLVCQVSYRGGLIGVYFGGSDAIRVALG
jgi:hypothetical protein